MHQFTKNCCLSSSQNLLGNFDKVVIVHVEPECSGQKENQFLIVSTWSLPGKRIHFRYKEIQ